MTLAQQSKFTKSAGRSQHDSANTFQCNWSGYIMAEQQGNEWSTLSLRRISDGHSDTQVTFVCYK